MSLFDAIFLMLAIIVSCFISYQLGWYRCQYIYHKAAEEKAKRVRDQAMTLPRINPDF